MSEQAPLSISLSTSSTKTAIPKIQDKMWCKFQFIGVKQKTLEGKGDVLEFEFHLAEPTTDTDGNIIEPGKLGSKMFKSVFLFGKDGEEAVLKRASADISRIIDGLLGTADPDNKKGKPVRPDFGPSLIPELVGKITFGQVRHPSDPQYNPDISQFKFPGDVTATA